jgi:hypothetical protein
VNEGLETGMFGLSVMVAVRKLEPNSSMCTAEIPMYRNCASLDTRIAGRDIRASVEADVAVAVAVAMVKTAP